MRPLTLPPNQLHRFYRGGEAIAALRGIEHTDGHSPEDWVGSTTTAFGSDNAGLSRFEDGALLRDALGADPEAFLGREHVERFGSDPELLVKLLHAGERLPVHLHPRRAFARAHLGSAHGKTEAWVIVDAAPGARVHVGFRDDVDAAQLRDWVTSQDVDALLGSLNELPVSAGDALLVPAGTPHAIGEGILLLELQEPSDFSILLETPNAEGIRPELGLGWELALDAVERRRMTPERLGSLRAAPRALRPGASALLPEAADAYFRAERLKPDPAAELDQGFSILAVLEGDGSLTATREEIPLRRGQTLLIPHAAGPTTLRGRLSALRCRPPDPRAGEGPW